MPKKKGSQITYPAGQKITGVAYLDDASLRKLGWRRSPIVLRFSGGGILYPTRDNEGNDAGTVFVVPKKSSPWYLFPASPSSKISPHTEMLIGRKVAEVVLVSHRWSTQAPALILDNNTILLPQSDEEGNNAGAWFGEDFSGDIILANR